MKEFIFIENSSSYQISIALKSSNPVSNYENHICIVCERIKMILYKNDFYRIKNENSKSVLPNDAFPHVFQYCSNKILKF